MNREDVVDVLTAVAVATNRTVGQLDVEIWQAVINEVPRDFALKSIALHLKEKPGVWLEPGHIFQRWKAFRQDELQRLSREERQAREDAIDARVLGASALVKSIPAGDGPVKFQRRPRPELLVECPWCHAQPKQACVVPQTEGALKGFHPSRAEAAKEASGE